MKNRIMRVIALFCALTAALSCLTFGSAAGDGNVGKRFAMFAYTLNDYIFTYGPYTTQEAGDSVIYGENGSYPRGVIYSEVVNFDKDKEPYLVIFLADSDYTIASCHIWKYDEQKGKTERIAIIDKNYMTYGDGQVGTFSMGFNGDKRYIVYKVYENDALIRTDYYTAIDGEAFKYIKAPNMQSEIGVADFSNRYFHANVDVSKGNRALHGTFDNYRNCAADSVKYENIADRLSEDDEDRLERVLSDYTGLTNFDIAEYKSDSEYKSALSARPLGDRFYLINEMYRLGDEMYYVKFSTDRSYYNYAILLRTDDTDDGYQILKVRTDCIPLSGKELEEIKTDYDRNTLLYKKAKNKLNLSKPGEVQDSESTGKAVKKPVIQFDKLFSKETRLPVICIGGGVAIALLTILWVYLFSDND